MTTCAFASEAESEVPRSLATVLTVLVNSLVAASTSLRRSSLRSDCASAMSLRSLWIASRFCVTASAVTVAGVRLFSSSTCVAMSSLASQTVFMAFSSSDSPHAPNASASTATTRTLRADLIP